MENGVHWFIDNVQKKKRLRSLEWTKRCERKNWTNEVYGNENKFWLERYIGCLIKDYFVLYKPNGCLSTANHNRKSLNFNTTSNWGNSNFDILTRTESSCFHSTHQSNSPPIIIFTPRLPKPRLIINQNKQGIKITTFTVKPQTAGFASNWTKFGHFR